MEMSEFRCGNCQRLLAKGEARHIVIKCPRCHAINHLRAHSSSGEPQDGQREKDNARTR